MLSNSRNKWPGGDLSSGEHDGRFSKLDELDDLAPSGHGVKVLAGKMAGAGNRRERNDGRLEEGGTPSSPGMVVPSMRIGVRTDVVVEISDRLAYNDRLY